MKIKCLTIEDEPLAEEKLKVFISEYPILDLVSSFRNAVDAITFLQENTVDLMFLDIQIKGFNGIQFLESLTQKPYVIITSAYDKYALKCYEFSVDDYLLKPYSFERFVKSVNKIAESISEKNAFQNNNQKESIFVHTEYRLERIELNDILYIEGMKDYLKIVTRHKKILTLQNFKSILAILPKDKFIRVHKSYIIAINNIESIEKNRIKINESLIPVSDSYKTELYDIIKLLNKS